MPPAPTTDLLNQVAAHLCNPQDTVKVKYIDVQMQDGSSDCGLFAIAFATALANGIQPGRCFFIIACMLCYVYSHCIYPYT